MPACRCSCLGSSLNRCPESLTRSRNIVILNAVKDLHFSNVRPSAYLETCRELLTQDTAALCRDRKLQGETDRHSSSEPTASKCRKMIIQFAQARCKTQRNVLAL